MAAQLPRPDIDLFSPENQKNPYKAYKYLRDNYPICELKEGQVGIFGYRNVVRALQEPELFSAGISAVVEPKWIRPDCRRDMFILGMDPPEHTVNRAVVNKSFITSIINKLAPYIQESARQLADKLTPGEPIEFVDTFAFPFTNSIISRILGVEVDLNELRRATELRELNTPSAPDLQHISNVEAALLRQNELLDAIIEQKKANPSDDLATVLVNLEVNGEPLPHQSIRSALDLFISAGFHSLGQLVTTCIIFLSEYPSLHERLYEHPESISSFIDEVLRFDGPVQRILRLSTQPIDMDEFTIPPGRLVGVFVASANRDPEHFPNPDTFLIDRPRQISLQFGHGAHRCIGSALSKLEAEIVVREIVGRFANISTPPIRELAWLTTMTTRGVRQCPTRFEPRER